MPLLTLVRSIVGLGVSTSSLTSIAGNTTNPFAMQLLALANDEGRSLARRHAWSALIAEKTFTTTAAAAQTGAIPSDFDRFVDETMYNRTLNRVIDGPVSPQEWQDIQASQLGNIDYRFRRRGSDLLFTPTPTADETVAYEYVRNTWVQSSGGTAQTAYQADSDTALLDESLIALGIKWRFREANGLDHETALREYERQVADAINRDGGRRTIDTTGPLCRSEWWKRRSRNDVRVIPI